MMYETPSEFYFRLHHIRPRFKREVENVLYFISTNLTSLDEMECDDFRESFRSIVRAYPGNLDVTLKTIDNWRTEISALFGFIEYDEVNGICKPSRSAQLLSENNNLIEFFRYFLFNFQYPGGHLRDDSVINYLRAGIKFKPVEYILRLLRCAQEINNNGFYLDKPETCHLIFNDLRVTRDNRDTRDVYELIIRNRQNGYEYDSSGDTIRYAGDILDYMKIAGLLRCDDENHFFLNNANTEKISLFIDRNEYFDGYDQLYDQVHIEISEVANIRGEWFRYVNREIPFAIYAVETDEIVSEENFTNQDFRDRITRFIAQHRNGNIRTNDIGALGENLTIHHEKSFLEQNNRSDLSHLVNKIPDTLAQGYDISSRFLDNHFKQIEVKTTMSETSLNSIMLTRNEINAANSYRDSYFIYRISIVSNVPNLYVIRNPLQRIGENSIGIEVMQSACAALHILNINGAGVDCELLI